MPEFIFQFIGNFESHMQKCFLEKPEKFQTKLDQKQIIAKAWKETSPGAPIFTISQNPEKTSDTFLIKSFYILFKTT